MHEPVKGFEMEGIISGKTFIRDRQRLIEVLEGAMRDEGYIPILDTQPHFTRSIRDDDNFDFELTVYGAYIGEESWEVSGMADGKRIGKYIPPTK